MVKRFFVELKNRYGIWRSLFLYAIGVGFLGIFPLLSLSTTFVVGVMLLASIMLLLGLISFKERFGDAYQFLMDTTMINAFLLTIALLMDSASPSLFYLLGSLGAVSKSYLGVVLIIKPFVAITLGFTAVNFLIVISEFGKIQKGEN